MSLLSSWLVETYSPRVKHLAVFTEKWLCLPPEKSLWEVSRVFILSQWCTATIIQLPSQKQLWLTKQPLTCLAIHAGVVSLQPHRRCAPLTLAFKSTTQAHGFASPPEASYTITHKLLDLPTRAAGLSSVVELWGVFFYPALDVQLLAESSWTLQTCWRFQRHLKSFVLFYFFLSLFLPHWFFSRMRSDSAQQKNRLSSC